MSLNGLHVLRDLLRLPAQSYQFHDQILLLFMGLCLRIV